MTEVFKLSKDQERVIDFLRQLKAHPVYAPYWEDLTVEGMTEKFENEWKAVQEKKRKEAERQKILSDLAADDDDEQFAIVQVERSLRRDIFWVADHLHNNKVKEKQAPSPTAWGMRESFKDDPATFYKTMLPKAMADIQSQANKDELEAEVKRREKKGINRYKELLREAVEASQSV